MRFAFLVFFLMFVSFSTERTRKWTLPHVSSQTDQKVNLQTQEQREIAKEKLKTLEERLQEHRVQNLQKLEERFHKREQIIKSRNRNVKKKQEVIQLQKKIQKYRQFAQEQSTYPNSSNLYNRLSDRKWSELSENEWNEPTKMKMPVRKLSDAKIFGSIKLYPNESSIEVFYDVETNVISWEDPDNLVRNEIKKSIELSSQQKGKAMSNGLFDCIFDWYMHHIPKEANPFVRELLFSMANFVEINRRDQSNRTPLMLAAGFNVEKVIVKLVERGANTESFDHDGRTALHYAAGNGNCLSCRALLQKGANINAQNKNGKTPLMWAALYGHLEIFKLLLGSGANTEIRSTHGETAFQLASPNWANVITAHKANLKINKGKFS